MRLLACVLVAMGCSVTGCAEPEAPPPAVGERFEMVRRETLAVQMGSAQRAVQVGETLEVTIRAMVDQDAKAPVQIVAPTGAKAQVEVQYHTGLGWETVKRYPQAATQQIVRWSIGPGEVWQQTLTLPVEPDWPTNEPLRLLGYLNGRRNVAPTLRVSVLPRSERQTE